MSALDFLASGMRVDCRSALVDAIQRQVVKMARQMLLPAFSKIGSILP